MPQILFWMHIQSVVNNIFVNASQVPPTLRFVMDGEMPDYLLAKDLILQVSMCKPQVTLIT